MAQTVEQLLIEIGVTGATDAETAFKKMRSALKGVQTPAAATNRALVDFGRITQDAAFGPIAIANNIEPMVRSFQALKVTLGSTTLAIKAMWKALMGPVGIAIALGAMLPLLPKIVGWFKKFRGAVADTEKATKEAAARLKDFQKAADEMLQLVAEEDIKVLEKALARVPDALEKAKTDVRRLRKEMEDFKETTVVTADVLEGGLNLEEQFEAARARVKDLEMALDALPRKIAALKGRGRQEGVLGALGLGGGGGDTASSFKQQVLKPMQALGPATEAAGMRLREMTSSFAQGLDEVVPRMTQFRVQMQLAFEDAVIDGINAAAFGFQNLKSILVGVVRQMAGVAAKMMLINALIKVFNLTTGSTGFLANVVRGLGGGGFLPSGSLVQGAGATSGASNVLGLRLVSLPSKDLAAAVTESNARQIRLQG